jgi:hypothetical protein
MARRFFVAAILAAGIVYSSVAYSQSDRDAMEEQIKEQVKAEMSGGSYSGPSAGGIDKESLKAQARQQLGLPGGAAGGTDGKQALKEQVKRELGIPKSVPAQAKKAKAASFDEAMKDISDPMALDLNKCKAGIVNSDSTFTSFGVSLWMLMVEFKLYKGSDGGPLDTSVDKDNNIFSIVVRDSGKTSSFKFSVDTDHQFARLAGAEIDRTKLGPSEALAIFSGLREKQAKTPFSQNDLNNAVLAAVKDIREAQKPLMEKLVSGIDPMKLVIAFAAGLLAIVVVVTVSRSGGKRPAPAGKPAKRAPAGNVPEERPVDDPYEIKGKPRGEKENLERLKREAEGSKKVYSAIDVYDQIEKLSQLKGKGVITGEDFEKKKKELLDRI